MTSDPKRLTVVGATDLERSLLQAARRERPSADMTARMAAGLGISVGAAITVAAPAASAAVPAAAAPVVAAKTTLGIWVAAGVVIGAVAAGTVGVRLSAKHEAPAVHVIKPAAPAIVAPAAPSARPAVVASDARVEKIHRRSVPAPAPAPAAGDLRDQIALIDAARAAVKGGACERALVLLKRYDASYPGGAFRPEAAALRIEALDQDGRSAEARALARDFLARYPQSPVAARVARIAAK